MRILSLFLPRLAVELMARDRPELRGRPLVLTSHPGDDGRVVAVAAMVAACGVLPGMSAAEARRHAPGAVFAPDNANACYDQLERVGRLLRLRATPLVELGGRDHLFIDLAGLDGGAGEAPTATTLAVIASGWSGLPVQAGVGSARAEALRAARAARRGPLVLEGNDTPASEPPIRDRGTEVIAARARCAMLPGQQPLVRLRQMLERLDQVLKGRAQASRELRVVARGSQGTLEARLRPAAPLARASEALVELRERVGDLAGVAQLRVELAGLVPAPSLPPTTLVARTVPPGCEEFDVDLEPLRAAG